MVDLKHKIAVFGLGYIGLPMVAALSHVGYNVVGVDIDEERVEMLRKNEMPFYEPGVKETLEKNKKIISYTTDQVSALSECDVIFVTVGTPLKEDETPDYSQIESCVKTIGENLRKGQLIILKSTLVIGTTEEYVKPNLEEISGLKAGEDFYLAFCPERTIEGLALYEIYNLPKIIGGINELSGLKTQNIMRRFGPLITLVSSPRVAETCKLADNIYRATNIAFANELGMLCERVGIKSNEVVSAVNNSYSRTKIFMPGLGADGPCLSKDPQILKFSAVMHGVETPLIDGTIKQNKNSTLRIAKLVKDHIIEKGLENVNLAILGVAFKGFPETDDLRGSPAIKILDHLKNEGLNFNSVKFYDPLVKNVNGVDICETIGETIDNSHVVLLLTNHPKIMNLHMDHFKDRMKEGSLIVDSWGNLDFSEIPEGINYFRIGHPSKK